MMGTKLRSFALHTMLSLEELVPQDHFYRDLDQKLDLSFVRTLVEQKYAQGGRPSIDPIVFFKLQLVMFFEGIRSERQLIRHASDRLSVRWYLGYDLGEPLPDHSSLTRIRTRYGIDVFRRFFETIVDQCQQAGLVWGKELYADATKVQANAALSSMKPRFAVEAHLQDLFSSEWEEPVQTEEGVPLQDMAACHFASAHDNDAVVPSAKEPFAVASQGRGDASECDVPPLPLHPALDEAIQKDLSISNGERQDWIERMGEPDREVVHGTYRRMADFWVSTTDPDATMMNGRAGGPKLGYHTHYVVDGGKARIILAVLVTPSEVMENQPVLDLLWRTRFRWKLWPRQFTGDTTYGTAEIITALEQQRIRPYVPLPDFDQRSEFFGQRDFHYDEPRDLYICPNGAELHVLPSGCTEQFQQYRAKASVCNSCPLKPQCTTSNTGRRISRHVSEEAFERVRVFHQTDAYKKAMNKRKVWVEPLFAEAKEWHGMRRFRLRQRWRVNCEALLVASGQNLKRLLKKRGWGRRPWPAEAICTVPRPGREKEELQVDGAPTRKKARFTIASLVSPGSTRKLRDAGTFMFSSLVIAHREVLLPVDVPSLSLFLASLYASVALFQNVFGEDGTKMIDAIGGSFSHRLSSTRGFFNTLCYYIQKSRSPFQRGSVIYGSRSCSLA
jgi:transposase